MAAIERLAAKSISHYFGTNSVLKDITFSVGRGEFVSLIGPSGCGKTTILNLLAGFMQPSAGDCLDERGRISGPSPTRTVIFQNYALFPWLNVRKNIACGLEAKGLRRDEVEARVDRWLNLVGLKDAANRYPSQLSGGMQQRVALARAMALDPEVVLMDEPFGALDLLTRESLQEEVLHARAETSGSFVLITHSVDEAVFMSDRIIVMSPAPGTIAGIVDVNLPYPREAQLRVDNPVFLSLRAQVITLLRSYTS